MYRYFYILTTFNNTNNIDIHTCTLHYTGIKKYRVQPMQPFLYLIEIQ